MNRLREDLYYLSISDLHLGIDKPPTDRLLDNLYQYFKDYHNSIKKCKIIFIAGDVYDKLLTVNSEEYIKIQTFLIWLLNYCYKYSIKLRILYGTPSHDWDQVKSIYNIYKELKLKTDFKYINSLELEKMKDLDLTILYIPDELNHDSEVTLEEVKTLLKDNNLDKVDIIIMHGQFPHQLPGIELKSSHNTEEYLKLVNYFINIGHIHKFSIYDKIISNGSLDRLAHNEEEDKGGVLIKLTSKGGEYRFLKNSNAIIFKTIEIDDTNINSYIEKLDKLLSKIAINSYIRLLFDTDNPVKKSMNIIIKRFPGYIFTVKNKKDDKKDIIYNVTEKREVEALKITKDNIKELMINEISKYSLSSKENNIFLNELDKVI